MYRRYFAYLYHKLGYVDGEKDMYGDFQSTILAVQYNVGEYQATVYQRDNNHQPVKRLVSSHLVEIHRPVARWWRNCT